MLNKIYKLDLASPETEEIAFKRTETPVINFEFPNRSKSLDISDGINYVEASFDSATVSLLKRTSEDDDFSVLKRPGTESEQVFSQAGFFGDSITDFVRQGSFKFKLNNPTANTIVLIRVSIL